MATDPSHPAPGRLELVRSLVNTEDRYGGHDELADPERAGAWLADRWPSTPRRTLAAGRFDGLLRLRATVRDLVAATTEGRPPRRETVAEFNRLAAAQPHVVRLDLDDAEGLSSTLRAHRRGDLPFAGEVVAAVHEAVGAGTWSRLKACANPECGWLFYDVSRSRTGRWCSMAACGSLHKARAYRNRRRDRAGP
ncbi:CGNR zinc finger domain-containing protein [Spirillospora sp. CA-294931]|uniref:CGNR zinc finger domain-containing protein n=1 Tax=Spirillospora sp. CA-294931 TaxID=3240042 RepID=UPI003D92464A